jgi:hypothetical protein
MAPLNKAAQMKLCLSRNIKSDALGLGDRLCVNAHYGYLGHRNPQPGPVIFSGRTSASKSSPLT